VQEEPSNMGGWNFLRHRLMEIAPPDRGLQYVGRPEGASTATGSLRAHRQEQAALIQAAFE
jgi:2-oxoglutarate dehydrogenase E1 component